MQNSGLKYAIASVAIPRQWLAAHVRASDKYAASESSMAMTSAITAGIAPSSFSLETSFRNAVGLCRSFSQRSESTVRSTESRRWSQDHQRLEPRLRSRSRRRMESRSIGESTHALLRSQAGGGLYTDCTNRSKRNPGPHATRGRLSGTFTGDGYKETSQVNVPETRPSRSGPSTFAVR